MSGTLSGIVALVFWSFTALLLVFTGNIPGLMLTGITFFLSAIILTVFQYFQKEDIKSYWQQSLGSYLFVVVSVCSYTALLYLSFKLVAPFEANTLNYLWPILLVLFAGLLHEEKMTVNKVLGPVLGFIGVLVLFYPRNGQEFFADFSWGHLFAASAALIWASYSILAKKKQYSKGIMAPVFFFSSIICFSLHLVFEQTIWPQTWLPWLAIIALSFLRISFCFWDYGMKNGNVILLASLSYFVPLLSTLFLLMVGVGPKDSFIGWGATFIIAGCLVVNINDIVKMIGMKIKKS